MKKNRGRKSRDTAPLRIWAWFQVKYFNSDKNIISILLYLKKYFFEPKTKTIMTALTNQTGGRRREKMRTFKDGRIAYLSTIGIFLGVASPISVFQLSFFSSRKPETWKIKKILCTNTFLFHVPKRANFVFGLVKRKQFLGFLIIFSV